MSKYLGMELKYFNQSYSQNSWPQFSQTAENIQTNEFQHVVSDLIGCMYITDVDILHKTVFIISQIIQESLYLSIFFIQY